MHSLPVFTHFYRRPVSALPLHFSWGAKGNGKGDGKQEEGGGKHADDLLSVVGEEFVSERNIARVYIRVLLYTEI